MLFRKLIPEDQLNLNEYIKNINNYQTDFSVATILLFQDFQNPEISIQENCIFIKGYMGKEEVFFSPLCKLENFNESMDKIISYFKQKDKSYKVLYIQKDYIKGFIKYKNVNVDKNFYENYGHIKSNDFIIFNDRNDSEYIYLPKSLIDLEGNKYRKIREKIRGFKKEYKNYEIIEYNEKELENIINMEILWNNEKYMILGNNEELSQLKYVIKNREKLNINIYILKINNNIAGMTIIQILPNNVGVIVYEKCLSKYKNASCILNAFEANKLKDCRGISRQDDIGIEGLRQAKLSYRPFYLENKFNLYQYNEKEYFLLYKNIFGDSDQLINLIKNSENYNIKQSTFILKNQKIISIGSTREKKLRIFNYVENIPFIFGIGTKKEEREKGYGGTLIKELLNKINFHKYNLAIIAPEEEYLIKYYKKFGFIEFNYKKNIPIENLFKKNFNIKIGNINDYQEIAKLFNSYVNKFKIAQYRDNKLTFERLKEVFIDDGKLLILSLNNNNYGYFIYEQGVITESINLLEYEPNENFEKVKEILINKRLNYILECKNINEELSIYENISKNIKAYSLIRLINPQYFVQKYIDYIFWEKKEDFNKNIIVKDEIIGDSRFNIKKIKNKNFFSINSDNNAINVEVSISDFMKFILRSFGFYADNNFSIQNKFFFTEKW